jgi:hypothetical protein
MSSRIRRPETTRLEITRGDWLLVKRHLMAGEERRILERMIKTMRAGEPATLDPAQAGISQMVEYLLDWSITDPDNKPVVIRDQSPTVIAAALNNLDIDSYNEIREAIVAHDAAMIAEREAEKNAQAGAPASPATLPSVA